jgi:hypothetical protein
VDVVGHDHEVMQQIGRAAVVIKSVDQQLCPAFLAKESAAFPGGGRHHVALGVVGRVFPFWLHFPQRLKPRPILSPCGTAGSGALSKLLFPNARFRTPLCAARHSAATSISGFERVGLLAPDRSPPESRQEPMTSSSAPAYISCVCYGPTGRRALSKLIVSGVNIESCKRQVPCQ